MSGGQFMNASNIQIIKKNGEKKFVVMPYEEFQRVQEELDDYQNLRCLRESKEAELYAPTISLEEVKKQLEMPAKKMQHELLVFSSNIYTFCFNTYCYFLPTSQHSYVAGPGLPNDHGSYNQICRSVDF
jgi:hypothetical protein